MTAEQLKELLRRAESHDAGWYNAQTELILLAPSLARRVLAAEKLADVAERMFEDPSLADVVALQLAIEAYREASK